jgi:NAD(P)-dependent dehydrogenase (short-subunit alcohol dehydrogenase family)
MRNRESIRVVDISSVSGFAQVPGWGVYGATKFAVEEAMRGELPPLGIDVIVVEPGNFRGFPSGHPTAPGRGGHQGYDETSGAVRDFADSHNNSQTNDPVKRAATIVTVATAAVTVATAANPPMRLQLGADSVAATAAKLEIVAAKQEQWCELALSTACWPA